jgi:hypothetical protein
VRPCPRCAFGLDNNAAVCPRCGAEIAAGQPRVRPGPTVETPSVVRGVVNELTNLNGDFDWILHLAVLPLPLGVGGGLGYLAWDGIGALFGVILTAVLIVAAKAWQEERHARGRSSKGPRKARLTRDDTA